MKILNLFLAVVVAGNLAAQVPVSEKNSEVIQFLYRQENDTLYLQGNEDGFNRLYSVIDGCLVAITTGQMPIYIDGYSASAPTEKQNYRLARIRSNRVKSELITHKGLLEEYFITQNHTTAFNGMKDVVVVTLRIPVPPTPVVEEVRQQPDPVTPTPVEQLAETTPVAEELSTTATPLSPSRLLDIRTNLLYDAFLTPTLGIEWHVSPKVGIKIDGSFAYWGNEHGRVHKLWIVSPEVRRYMGNARRFYIGAGGNIGKFNIYKGMVGGLISGQTGYQGKLYGGGLTAGYLLKLSNNFSLDFNLGLGYTRLEYDSFAISNQVREYKGKDLTKNIWGPTQAGITLVWHFIK